jgi:CheY-like chemotaxis protein
MADDDEDDRHIAERALAGTRLEGCLRFVEDGERLLAYLRGQAPYDGVNAAPRPNLILLDLNMPRVDGREALDQIKSDPALRRIPVVILTTSSAEEDVLRSYDLGVNAFVTKPVTFRGLSKVLQQIGQFWFDVAKMPAGAWRQNR